MVPGNYPIGWIVAVRGDLEGRSWTMRIDPTWVEDLDDFRINVTFDPSIGEEKFELHVKSSSRIVYVKEDGRDEEKLKLEGDSARYECSGVCELRIGGGRGHDVLRFVPLCGVLFGGKCFSWWS